MIRGDALQSFLDAAFAAFDRHATDIRARKSVMQLFTQLETPAVQREAPPKRLPVCERYLSSALNGATSEPSLERVVSCFRDIEPFLEWRWRSSYDNSASDNFLMSHANGMIVGPGGVEDRKDVWLGVTLMAPHVRYPDHDHPPEETYLVMSEGEFRQADNDWFEPGIGGSFFNVPGIRHAMRSGSKPLLALWALRADGQSH